MAYFNFHQDDITEFKAVFFFFDKTEVGTISSKQLGIALKCLEPKPSINTIKNVLRKVEVENDGAVTFQKFLDVLYDVIETEKIKNEEKPKRKRSCHTNLSHDQINEIKDAFDMFDRDGDGTISIDELKTVMESMGQNPTEDELKSMLTEVSASKKLTIEFPEFFTMMTRKMSSGDMKNEIVETFRFFDTDEDGSITAPEVKEAMVKLGETITNEEIEEMMKEADLDGDGTVDFTEFVKMMSLPKS